MTPKAIYQRDLQQKGFYSDAKQAAVLEHLQMLYESLLTHQSKKTSLFRWFKKSSLPKGIYIWGTVGRGKTYLTDLFYESLPFNDKLRVHYFRFMKRIHSELSLLKGKKDPLAIVAKHFAREARVIVLDEFFVNDIADAMLLGRLLKFLFEQHVVLVTTSNIFPDNLYRDGLQRDLFLPAIALLKENMHVVALGGDVDYRLRTLKQMSIYYTPIDCHTKKQFQENFFRLTAEKSIHKAPTLMVEGRPIPAVYEGQGIVYFTFQALCDGPRSQNDYIALSNKYHTCFLESVPVMSAKTDDMMRRFINLIDELYDRRVNLVLMAEKPIHELYTGIRLAFEYQRTVSRLNEMQSDEYLAMHHRPGDSL